MRITRLEVTGYGIWGGLRVEDFGPGLNVIFGPNEAGKTTLLEFLRWVLYGSASRPTCCLPPLHGGRTGGSIHVAAAAGPLEVARYCTQTADGKSQEQLNISSADGTQQDVQALEPLLGGIDEPTFRNVFAVGLWELQELGTLSGTDAADRLYDLSLGVDGRLLLEVMRELEISQRRIVDDPDAPSQLRQLLAERASLRRQAAKLETGGSIYIGLLRQRRQLASEIRAAQSQRSQLEQQLRCVELASRLAQQWQQRIAIDEQLASIRAPQIPPGAVARLDALQAAVKRRSRRMAVLRRRWRELGRQAADIPLRKALWRQAGRIEALAEQQSWLKSLQERLSQLQQEADDIRDRLTAQQQQLAVHTIEELEGLIRTPAATLCRLRPAAQAVAHALGARRQAKQALAAAQQEQAALAAELEAALSARGEKDLAAALDRAGELAARCRRTVQLEQRIEQIIEHQQDLEQQSHRLCKRLVLPLWVLAALGAVFALGVMLVLAGLLLPGTLTGSLGWAMALLGVAGVAVAAGGKLALERANAKALEACRKQMAMLHGQLQQLQQQREALQQQLGGAGGAPQAFTAGPARLAEAEKLLASLEELSPLQARVHAAAEQVSHCHSRLAHTKAELRTARQQWAEAVVAAALPQSLSPRRLRSLLLERRNIQELFQRLKLREEELAQRQAEWSALAERIEQLCADAGVAAAGSDPLEQLQQLCRQLDCERDAVRQRASIVRQRRRLRRQAMRQRTVLARLARRRRKLLAKAGVHDEQQFRRRAELAARVAVLRSQRDSLDNQIEEALAGHPDRQTVRELLDRCTAAELDQQHARLREQLAELDARLQGLFHRQGQSEQQLSTLGEDRQPGFKRLELGVNAHRIRQAIDRWQVLALCGWLLETICRTYQSQRQPETLRTASEYLRLLTGGRMQRVWTPLGERTLRIDQADGPTLAVEALSRGTREQLFLSLRLALAGWYAQRGTRLPLILDDVLVNFDSQRSKAAAQLLQRFAAEGHQLLVFTCHEHILALFGELGVPVGRLPDCSRPNPPTLRLAPPEPSKPHSAAVLEPMESTVPGPHSRRHPRRPSVQREPKPAAEPSQAVNIPVAPGQRRSFDADYFDSRELAAISPGGQHKGSNGTAPPDQSLLPDQAND